MLARRAVAGACRPDQLFQHRQAGCALGGSISVRCHAVNRYIAEMRNGSRIGVVIPALNEADAIGRVVREIPAWVDDIVVGDNGSTDRTAAHAQAAGARVVHQAERGYGAACLAALATLPDVDVVVFIDGDLADYPEDMAQLVDPIVDGQFDFVLGSRTLGQREAGSLTPQQVFGNGLATTLIYLIWRIRYSDLGPYRAIRKTSLDSLEMVDRN